ncbi:MAG: hypothetical protein B7X06_03995 [Verrucomicrobia bacterium 21-51-4]|nr:MAG: hypothetical protein B7X06_03995 [Verrucomicrobia bacterium 21-51-4]
MGLLKTIKSSTDIGTVVGIDCDPWASGSIGCDHFEVVEELESPQYLARLESLCQQYSIGLIIPTREADMRILVPWAKNHTRAIATSSLETLDLCQNKVNTYQWLSQRGFPVAPWVQWRHQDPISLESIIGPLPWFSKDPQGRGSIGCQRIEQASHLQAIPDGWILQPHLSGQEYTLNGYVDRCGKCHALIPHARLRVSGGEVSHGVTVRDNMLIDLGRRVIEALPGAYGPINMQVFWNRHTHQIAITDINPRLGGGYPLSHASGGKFVQWLAWEALGRPLPENAQHTWQDQVRLLGYRDTHIAFPVEASLS